MRSPRSGADAGERGQSSIGAIAGTTVVLAFLFVCVHLIVGLYATSTVTAEAYDAARRVASADIDHGDPVARARAQSTAESDARRSLGPFRERVQPFDWTGTDDDVVRLRVRAESPSLLAFGAGPLGVEHIDRTVTVRVERVR